MPFEVVLDISGLGPDDLAARATLIANAALARPVYSSLSADFTALLTAAQVIETKSAAIADLQAQLNAAYAERLAAVPVVTDKLNSLGPKIGEAAQSEADLEAIHITVPKPHTTRPIPERPTLKLTYGDNDGEVDGQTDSQRGLVDIYVARWTTTDPASPTAQWTEVIAGFRSSFTLPGLPSGAMVWIQLRGRNTTGQSPWSDPACIRVP